MDLTIEAYARLMAELAAAGDGREAVLAQHGLTEASWEAIDDRFQDELSAAIDPEDDGVGDIVSRYAAAYAEAQRALSPPITVEQLAMATRLFQASGDLRAALAKVGITLADYMRGTEHWSKRFPEDEEAERRFHEVVARGE